jgi:nucleoside-diphosphate-sugar epimerase
MPVIVVGADTPLGLSIVSALLEPEREVRAFVSDVDVSLSMKAQGVKVALGDVSDPSHVGAACLNCFSAVFVTEAARDERERAFARDRRTVLDGWTEAAREADVSRVIWVDAVGDLPPTGIDETAVVNPDEIDDVAAEVVRLDDVATL